jgi:hypothetical protein
MRRNLLYVFLPLIVAVLSGANMIVFRLDNLLKPSWPAITMYGFYAGIAAVVVFAAMAIFIRRWWILVPALVLVAVAGFLPRAADFYAQSQQQAAEQVAGADAEMQFQSDYLDRSDDVDDRIGSKKPYTAEEALAFLDFAADADLSWRSLPDHTPELFTLVEQAIAGGILDPNALVTPPTADSPAVTVTLAFYDKRIRPSSPGTIEKHAWDVLQILIAKGADVSSPDATQLRADLAKTVVLGTGRYISLQ